MDSARGNGKFFLERMIYWYIGFHEQRVILKIKIKKKIEIEKLVCARNRA